MAALRVYLLGPFQVFSDGRPVRWQSRQMRTILKALMAHRGEVVSHDQLLEMIWPGRDPDTARRHLYVRVSQVRRLLDPGQPQAYIQTVTEGYQFAPAEPCWIDVEAFEAAAMDGQQAQRAGRLAEAAAAYERALALYRGDFLAEDLYEEWTLAERERLREHLLITLTELAECYAQVGRYRRGIATCRRALAIDSCREAAYVRLMLYHYYAGEQAQALQTFERCCDVLRVELNIAPLPFTVTLADRIRAGTLWAAPDAPRYPPPAYEGQLFEVPYSLGRTPFAGRDREYAWLVERWRAPGVRAILIEGEAGIGKSRLVDEFLGYAAQDGAVVLRTAALPAEASLPYAPIVGALQGVPELWDGEPLSPPTLAVLQPLFPELRARFPDLASPADLASDEEQQRLVGAVVALLEARFPAGGILFVDDAHHVDPATLALLVAISDRLKLILACRTAETPPDHPLRRALRPLRQEKGLAELQLDPLSPTEARTLLSRITAEATFALGEQILERTGGNPLFLIALLQHLFESGSVYIEAGGRWAATEQAERAIAPTVRRIVEQRLRNLRPAQRRVFDTVAIAGGHVDLAWLPPVCNLDADPLLDLVDGLLQAGLLVEPRAAGEAELAAAHDYYVAVAYEMVPHVRRRQLHRRLAETLETAVHDLDAAAATLAYHYERARCAPQTFAWSVRAGDVAAARYAHQEALAYYQKALALAAGETAPVLTKMGQIAHHLARYTDGVQYHEGALARWRDLDDRPAAIRAQYALAECHRELSHYAEASQVAEAGLAAAELAGDPLLTARGHLTVSNAMRSGQLAPVETIRGHLLRARDLAVQAGAGQLRGEAGFWLGVVAVNCGDTGAAIRYDHEALDCFRRMQAAGWEAITCNNLAYHTLLAGQAAQAQARAEEGLVLAQQIGSLNAQGWLLSTLGEIQTHLGRLEEARATLTAGLTLVTRYGPRRLRPGFLVDLARVAISGHEWDAALAHLEEALDLALETAPQFVPRLRLTLAEALLGQGELLCAGDQARQAQTAAREKGQRGVEGQAWRLCGQVHAAAGRPVEAGAAFARSLAELEATGNRLEAARTQGAWGRWLAGQRDPRATALLEAARAEFERSDAVLDLAILPT